MRASRADAAIAVGGVVVVGNENTAVRIHEKRAHWLSSKDSVDEIVDGGDVLLLGIDLDLTGEFREGFVFGLVGVAVDPVECGGPALAVFEDHNFAVEAVGVLQDAMDEAAQHVGVGAAAAFPLGVDFEDDDVVGGDEAVGAAEGAAFRGAVEFFAAQRELVQQCIDADVAQLAVVRGAVIDAENLSALVAGLVKGVEIKGAQERQSRGGTKKGTAGNAAQKR